MVTGASHALDEAAIQLRSSSVTLQRAPDSMKADRYPRLGAAAVHLQVFEEPTPALPNAHTIRRHRAGVGGTRGVGAATAPMASSIISTDCDELLVGRVEDHRSGGDVQ